MNYKDTINSSEIFASMLKSAAKNIILNGSFNVTKIAKPAKITYPLTMMELLAKYFFFKN